jgi:hypothetical protein
MTATVRPCAVALAAIVATGATVGAMAQTTAADSHHPDTTLAQATPSPGEMVQQGQGAQPGQPGMTSPGMMGPGMMGPGMMGPGMMGAMPMMRMRGPMMNIVFAIADLDGDGALSFEEVTTIHKRIFDKIDANKDGKVTPEEVQAFMRE